MRFRLPHILALMGLMLLAGVLSVRQLESRVGATTVPGIVIVDCPGLGVSAADAVLLRIPGVGMQWVTADGQLLSPFDGSRVQRLRARGFACALVRSESAAPPESTDAARRDWGVLLEDLSASDAGAALAAFVREQHGVRPFAVALDLAGAPVSELLTILEPLVAAAESLPSFRRTAIVVLGVREPDSARRLALRINSGTWANHDRPALLDLLDDD